MKVNVVFVGLIVFVGFFFFFFWGGGFWLCKFVSVTVVCWISSLFSVDSITMYKVLR